jgi:hypothetical protein
MMDRRNRVVAVIVGFVALVGGVSVLLLGSGVFGAHRSGLVIFDGAVLRKWDSYGAGAYAVVGAVGFVALVLGLLLASREWRRNDGMKRAGPIAFAIEPGVRGQTTLHTPSLSHALERDLERLSDVKGARVGLFGDPPHVELRSVLDVDDDADLAQLPIQFDEALTRFHHTVGFRPAPIQVTLRFREGRTTRQME